MKRERDPKLYQKLLKIFQWHKHNKLYTLKTGIIRKHIYNRWDAQQLYKGWLSGATIKGYGNLETID